MKLRSVRRAGALAIGCSLMGALALASTAVATTPTMKVVLNEPPTASFLVFPSAPRDGETIDFVSTSSDPDGPIAQQTWDLDNDGLFDDGSGEHVQATYLGPATETIRLRVEDSWGAATIATKKLFIRGPVTTPRLLSPFPLVRIVGRLTGTGAKLRLLAVKAPPGSKITVRCRGKGCPYRRRTTHAGKRRVRFKAIERRLRAGAQIKVLVTKANKIGKYVGFRIRRGKLPLRADRCLMPRSTKPVACPE